MELIETALKRLVKAAIEAFPIDSRRKAVILRRILGELNE